MTGLDLVGDLGILAGGAAALIAGTAKAIVWVKNSGGPSTNGNGAAEARGWQKAVMERQVDLLEILVEGQGTERQMLRESMEQTQTIARTFDDYGKQQSEILERVSQQLDVLAANETRERERNGS